MDRRELLKMIAALTGGAVIGADFLLAGCKNPSAGTAIRFTEKDIAFLDEVAETILPATNTPGAKAAQVGRFMTVIVTDCYEETEQKVFYGGMQQLDEASRKMFQKSFMNITPANRHQLLLAIDKEAREYQKKKSEFDKDQNDKEKAEHNKGNKDFKKEKMPSHYFTLMKQLTIWGYFTSKEGITQALRYVPVPGRYEGCIDYKKADKIFSGLT